MRWVDVDTGFDVHLRRVSCGVRLPPFHPAPPLPSPPLPSQPPPPTPPPCGAASMTRRGSLLQSHRWSWWTWSSCVRSGAKGRVRGAATRKDKNRNMCTIAAHFFYGMRTASNRKRGDYCRTGSCCCFRCLSNDELRCVSLKQGRPQFCARRRHCV